MRDDKKRVVQTSLTRLFDTAMATRSRLSGKSLGFPNTCLGFSAENSGVLVLGVPSSLSEGRAKTRTPGSHNPGATKAGHRGLGFSGVSERFQLEEIRVESISAGDELMALGRFC